MPIDFFQVACQEPFRSENLFGICDSQNGNAAYTDIANSFDWVTKVINEQNIDVQFTAIDNCIEILRDDGNIDNRCDGMLTYQNSIVFIELKDQRSGWITDAINQLEVTITHFLNTPNNITRFRHKRAFACNKQHPRFNYSNAERAQKFFNQYRVRLNIHATIKI